MTFLIACSIPLAVVFAVWVLLRPEREKRKSNVMTFSLVSERERVNEALAPLSTSCCSKCSVAAAQERMAERLRERVNA